MLQATEGRYKVWAYPEICIFHSTKKLVLRFRRSFWITLTRATRPYRGYADYHDALNFALAEFSEAHTGTPSTLSGGSQIRPP